MAAKTDFNYGTTINGPVSYIIKYKLNGQVVFDPSIASVTQNALVDLGDGNILVSGSFGKISVKADGRYKFVLPDHTLKGADIEYILLSKEVGAYRCYSKTNNEVDFYYYENGKKVNVVKLVPGLRFWIQSTTALVVGEKETIASSTEYQIHKATSGETAFLLVEKGCSANGVALVTVIQKEVIA